MNLQESLQKLFSLHQFGIKLGLDNIQNLLLQIGNPEKKLKTFHIAGSNGKGSTASFISSILMEAGFKTGLYTSPHFVKFNERIRINGIMIPDKFVLEFMNNLSEYIDNYSPTFFELTTAMAFKYFAEENVDFAVIETGLGGRLDATNTIQPLASIITTISKEHTNILSDSISRIAYEKGEIIKSDSKAYMGILPDEAKDVIINKANSVNTPLYSLEKFIEKKHDFVKLNLGVFHYTIYKTPLSGYHQLVNAATAVLSVSNTLEMLDYSVFSRGINNVLLNSGIQGRYEIYCRHPRVIFDAAHNLEGVNVFLNEFRKEAGQYDKKILIFGVMKDKALDEMILALSENFDEFYATSIDYERAATIEEITKIAEKFRIKVNRVDKPLEYLKSFEKEKNNHCLVILGSIYLLGEIKENLLNLS